MAKCVDYLNGQECPWLLGVSSPNATFPVNGKVKELQQHCLYCMKTPGVRKIGHKASYTGLTPKWCPLGRDEK